MVLIGVQLVYGHLARHADLPNRIFRHAVHGQRDLLFALLPLWNLHGRRGNAPHDPLAHAHKRKAASFSDHAGLVPLFHPSSRKHRTRAPLLPFLPRLYPSAPVCSLLDHRRSCTSCSRHTCRGKHKKESAKEKKKIMYR